MDKSTLTNALAAMQAAGTFYAYRRPGSSKLTLWRIAERYGYAPVTPEHLRNWCEFVLGVDRAEAVRLPHAILAGDLSGFPSLSPAAIELVVS